MRATFSSKQIKSGTLTMEATSVEVNAIRRASNWKLTNLVVYHPLYPCDECAAYGYRPCDICGYAKEQERKMELLNY